MPIIQIAAVNPLLLKSEGLETIRPDGVPFLWLEDKTQAKLGTCTHYIVVQKSRYFLSWFYSSFKGEKNGSSRYNPHWNLLEKCQWKEFLKQNLNEN